MRISGKFINRKIRKQIALILLLPAFIPTALITGLTYQTIDRLIKDHSHQKLVDTSRGYALSAFSNLTFARASLIDLSELSSYAGPLLQQPYIQAPVEVGEMHINIVV